MFQVNYKATMSKGEYKTYPTLFKTKEEATTVANNLELKARADGAFIGTRIIEINDTLYNKVEEEKPIIIKYNFMEVKK